MQTKQLKDKFAQDDGDPAFIVWGIAVQVEELERCPNQKKAKKLLDKVRMLTVSHQMAFATDGELQALEALTHTLRELTQ